MSIGSVYICCIVQVYVVIFRVQILLFRKRPVDSQQEKSNSRGIYQGLNISVGSTIHFTQQKGVIVYYKMTNIIYYGWVQWVPTGEIDTCCIYFKIIRRSSARSEH